MVEAFGNRSGQDSLFDLLRGPQASAGLSFIANDDIHSLTAMAPELSQMAKWDTGTNQLATRILKKLFCLFVFP